MKSNCLLFLLLITSVFYHSFSHAETLRRGNGSEPDSLDPQYAQSIAAQNILRDLCTGLYILDSNGEATAAITKDARWNESKTTFDVYLKTSHKWSDGTAVTSADFIRTFDELKSDTSPFSVMWSTLISYKSNASDHISLRFDKPVPWLKTILAHPMSCPRHKNRNHKMSASSKNMISVYNGAYKLIDWKIHNHILIEKTGLYPVAFDRVEYYPTEDAFTELLQFRSNDLDITDTLPPGRLQWVRENLPGKLRITPYLGSFFLSINTQSNALKSQALRKALSLVIDREILTDKILANGEVSAWSIIPPGVNASIPVQNPDKLMNIKERTVLALSLLKEAQIEPDKLPILEIRYNTSPIHRRTMLAVTSMWKQRLGIRSRLINEEWKVFVINRQNPSMTQVFRGGWIADYNDSLSFLELFHSKSPMNFYGFRSAEFDALIMSTGVDRAVKLQQAEKLILDQQVVIPLYYYVSRHMVADKIKGWNDNVLDVHLSRWLY